MPKYHRPLGGYHPPQIKDTGAALSGYNAYRHRRAVEQRPMAAEIQQEIREENPAIVLPVPAPPRATPPAPAGLAVDPAIAAQIAEPVPGSPFANEVYQRNVPERSPGVDTRLAEMAGGGLVMPDPALADEPLPASTGERAGMAMRDTIAASGLNPQSPDFKSALPGLVSIGHEAIRPGETEAMAAQRNAAAAASNARAGDLQALAVEREDNATSKRKLEQAQADALKAKGEHDKAQERARVTAERARGGEAAAVDAHRRAVEKLNVSKAKIAAAQKALDEAQLLPKGGIMPWSGPDQRTPAVDAATKARDAAVAELSTLDRPAPPPTGRPEPPMPTAVGADQAGEADAVEAAYTELVDPQASEIDREAARQFLRERGLPETR